MLRLGRGQGRGGMDDPCMQFVLRGDGLVLPRPVPVPVLLITPAVAPSCVPRGHGTPAVAAAWSSAERAEQA